MTTLNASARLVNPDGVAERVFWLFLISRGAVMPTAVTPLVDRQGRGTPVFLDVLSGLSDMPPSAAETLVNMPSGLPTAFFHKFLVGLP